MPLNSNAIETTGAALAAYLLGLLFVLAGLILGQTVVPRSTGPHSRLRAASSGTPLVDSFTYWDGQWYLEIAANGYNYRPGRQSNVAFFPAYPILIRAVSRVVGLPSAWAALLVSHSFLLASCWLFFDYMLLRFPESGVKLRIFALLSLALFPPTFFMRMAYTESLFVFLTILAAYGMARKWPLWAIASVVGTATATRFAGVALLLPLGIHIWQCGGHRRASSNPDGSRSVPATMLRVTALLPLAFGGLAVYMLYQWREFREPLAFIRTQDYWRVHIPENLGDKLFGLASWEPVWSAYLPSWPGFAGRIHDPAPALVSLQFANPVYFMAAVALVVVGAWNGWLTSVEIGLAAAVILVGYAAKGFEMCMASQGRFVATAFPIYIVFGQILVRLPRPCAIAILALFAAYLAIYSAMLSAGYVLI